ncbi:alkaline phosphatase [Cyanobacterium stanieri PCC 7202]|uniref:Alkaline phosphatase n=1 Tax=Cyanobacterium stanieri (strain ATCC 29140 / PCC 7202) TaxID=292563 RepID=K9YQP3_CYASC|nr:alkaline phosphatase [Cyanobacterium stanieri PCC 7202]
MTQNVILQGSFQSTDFLRSFNIFGDQGNFRRPEGRPVDEFEFSLTSNASPTLTVTSPNLTGSADFKLILINTNTSQVVASSTSAGGSATISSTALNSGVNYRLQVVGRGGAAPLPNLFGFTPTPNYTLQATLPQLGTPQFQTFQPRVGTFTTISSGLNSVSATGVLANSDNLFVARQSDPFNEKIVGFTDAEAADINGIGNGRVGFADEYRFSVDNPGSASNVIITITGVGGNALGINNSGPYVAVLNDSTGDIIGQTAYNVAGFATDFIADDNTTVIDIPAATINTLVNNGDNLRLKIAGFEVEGGAEIGNVNSSRTLGYNVNIFSSGRNISLEERTPAPIGGPQFLTLDSSTAQIAYVAYYGRPADPSGRTFWSNVLANSNISYSPRSGDVLANLPQAAQDAYSQFVNDFGNSTESGQLFGGLNTVARINQIYQQLFNRQADNDGLNFWFNAINSGDVSLPAAALEIALGATSGDLTILENKIDSSNLFTTSLVNQGVASRYDGQVAVGIGRDFLSNVGLSVATQAQVNTAINSLPV